MTQATGQNPHHNPQQLFTNHIETAHAHRKQQNWAEAERHFTAALAIDPVNPHALTFIAQMQYRQGFEERAIRGFGSVIRQHPQFPLAHMFLGELHLANKRYKMAIPPLEQAINLGSATLKTYLSLGKALREIRYNNEAIRILQNGLQQHPNSPELLQSLGEVANEERKFEIAEQCFARITQLNPQNAFAFSNWSLPLTSLNRIEEAWTANRKAQELLPNSPIIENNVATLLRFEDRIEESIAVCRAALEKHPDHDSLTETLGLSLLSNGELKEAFICYDARWMRPGLHAREVNLGFIDSRWTGQPLAGKTLFVWPEQGFGDYLQFLRYVPLAIEQGAKVIVGYQPPMKRLVENLPGLTDIIDITQYKKDDVKFDYNCPMLSLPIGFETTLESVPANTPYIYTDESTKAGWKEKLSTNKLKVGLVWAGKSQHIFDRDRSMDLTTISPLLDIDDVQFYSLQVPADPAIASCGKDNIIDLAPELTDYMETMGAIDNMDLVISVDTSVAHLVGALNKPVWMLLSSAPSLMWLREREDSPWYPTMKIFRQSKQETWQPVIERTKSALEELVTKTSK